MFTVVAGEPRLLASSRVDVEARFETKESLPGRSALEWERRFNA